MRPTSGEAFVAGTVEPIIVHMGGTPLPPEIGDTITILTAVRARFPCKS